MFHENGLGSTRLLSDENGEVLESYQYDAYGNLIGGEIGDTSHLFAGEQRDSLTGLDYLRARYYDPTLGRFISRDAYQGSLDDPMSLHKYQYAHANPVVNTDPSGYFSLGQITATLALHTTLAGLSFTTGAAGAVLATGGSFGDAAALYDQFFAGMLDSLTFGISTTLRRKAYGATAIQNHRGLFFNLGRLGGAAASMAIGAFGTTFAKFSSAPWWARAALGYDIFGATLGIGQSIINIAKGQATWWDIINFLPFLTWLNINYKVTRQGVSFGSDLGNLNNLKVEPRNANPITILYHGTSSNRASKIVGNQFYEIQGFKQVPTYLAEDYQTAYYFAREHIGKVDVPHIAKSITVIEFKIPEEIAESLNIGAESRRVIGQYAELRFPDIPGSTGYERVLTDIQKFNEALKEGTIHVRRKRTRLRY